MAPGVLTCQIHCALTPAEHLEAKELHDGWGGEGGIVGVEGNAWFVVFRACFVDPRHVRVGLDLCVLHGFCQLQWVALDTDAQFPPAKYDSV